MVNGMYVSPERVIRGGFLVAYKGEVMGADEAARRGLVPEGSPGKAQAKRGAARNRGGKAK